MEFLDKYTTSDKPDEKKIEISKDAYAIGEMLQTLTKLIDKTRRGLLK